MHRGQIRALGTPAELRDSIGPDATLDDVFRAYTGDRLAEKRRHHARRPRHPPHREEGVMTTRPSPSNPADPGHCASWASCCPVLSRCVRRKCRSCGTTALT